MITTQLIGGPAARRIVRVDTDRDVLNVEVGLGSTVEYSIERYLRHRVRVANMEGTPVYAHHSLSADDVTKELNR